VLTPPMTPVEAHDGRTAEQRWDWTLSRPKVADIGKDEARQARRLLADAKLHGHKYAIDATARSRNSSGYFLGAGIVWAPFVQPISSSVTHPRIPGEPHGNGRSRRASAGHCSAHARPKAVFR
jgi:hypothetical protein